MRISYWSSDVCSSDLFFGEPDRLLPVVRLADDLDFHETGQQVSSKDQKGSVVIDQQRPYFCHFHLPDILSTVLRCAYPAIVRRRLAVSPGKRSSIGRASCRERRCQYA